jgi:hypothetical protein
MKRKAKMRGYRVRENIFNGIREMRKRPRRIT